MTIQSKTKPKLIIVEGFPGSGKTTMANYVKKWLDDRDIANRMFLEGNLRHPADYESVAYFTREAYAELLARFPEQSELIASYCTIKGEDHLIGYWLLKDNHPDIPDALFEGLMRHEIYYLPDFALHARLIREHWQEFTTKALAGEDVYVFECCLLQNSLTTSILQYNRPDADSRQYTQSLLDVIEPLHPVILYLYQQDLRASLETIVEERDPAWHNAVGDYVNQGAWSKATGNTGFEGYIRAAPIRQAIELALLKESPITNAVLDVSARDWTPSKKTAGALLEKVFGQE